jgi:uncharacterized protein YjiS (DUF1127 family)
MPTIALHSQVVSFPSANRKRRLQIDRLWELLRVWGRRVRDRSELKIYMEMQSGSGDTGIFIADAQQELSKQFWQP